jgi:hypothetical protein
MIIERRSVVHQVRQIGPREARGAARQHGDVHVVGHRDLPGVDVENALAALHVGPVDHDAAVEAAGTEERRIEHVGPVGGRD